MSDLHGIIAIVVIAVNLLAAAWGAVFLLRKRPPGRVFAHLLALGQSLVIAQVAIGLLLVSDGLRTIDRLHYLYGVLALGVILSPWLYAPPVPVRRLMWFTGACLVGSALAIRAYTTGT